MDKERTRVSVLFYETDVLFSEKSAQFNASQIGMYAPGKAHKLCAPPRLLKVSPNVALETVPTLV